MSHPLSQVLQSKQVRFASPSLICLLVMTIVSEAEVGVNFQNTGTENAQGDDHGWNGGSLTASIKSPGNLKAAVSVNLSALKALTAAKVAYKASVHLPPAIQNALKSDVAALTAIYHRQSNAIQATLTAMKTAVKLWDEKKLVALSADAMNLAQQAVTLSKPSPIQLCSALSGCFYRVESNTDCKRVYAKLFGSHAALFKPFNTVTCEHMDLVTASVCAPAGYGNCRQPRA